MVQIMTLHRHMRCAANRWKSSRMRILWVVGALWLALMVPAAAHPHVWIDMTVSSVFDEDGQLSGFRHVWAFDEFYTVFQLEGFDLAQGNVPAD